MDEFRTRHQNTVADCLRLYVHLSNRTYQNMKKFEITFIIPNAGDSSQKKMIIQASDHFTRQEDIRAAESRAKVSELSRDPLTVGDPKGSACNISAQMPTTTENEFFQRHFRHRITLLETFRERFGDKDVSGALDWKTCGDLYRCAMDISMAMVRYFCEELGIKNRDPKSDKLECCRLPERTFAVKRLSLTDFDSTSGEAVKKVLLAANKAIAHLNEEFVNEIPEPSVIVEAINQTQEWIKTRIFEPNGISYDETVATERSEMRREQPIVFLRQRSGS